MTRKTTATTTAATPEAIVTRFLQALEHQDHDTIATLLAPDLHYTNVSLPTLKGGQRVASLLRFALRPGTGFGVQTHRLAVNGDIVMTERTDLVKVGPLHMGLWVCGTFRVQDGRIVLWRDYFDWMNVTCGALRGLAGIAWPRWRASLPVTLEP